MPLGGHESGDKHTGAWVSDNDLVREAPSKSVGVVECRVWHSLNQRLLHCRLRVEVWHIGGTEVDEELPGFTGWHLRVSVVGAAIEFNSVLPVNHVCHVLIKSDLTEVLDQCPERDEPCRAHWANNLGSTVCVGCNNSSISVRQRESRRTGVVLVESLERRGCGSGSSTIHGVGGFVSSA